MPKILKEYIAGFLHKEIIGNVPIPRNNRRLPRRSPTRKAQVFYNLKRSWMRLELILAANFDGTALVAVFTYDDKHLPKNKAAAAKFFYNRFIRPYKKIRDKRGEDFRWVYVTEGFHGRNQYGYKPDQQDGELEDRRLHHHMVLNGIGPGDIDEIKSLWPGGGYIYFEPLDIHYYQELAKYLTKEPRDFSQRVGSHAWSTSKNLNKPKVVYTEVPDNVTLSAPVDAVDYTQFNEKNPYGFADCVGARYLIIPKPKPPNYSYTRGRNAVLSS